MNFKVEMRILSRNIKALFFYWGGIADNRAISTGYIGHLQIALGETGRVFIKLMLIIIFPFTLAWMQIFPWKDRA